MYSLSVETKRLARHAAATNDSGEHSTLVPVFRKVDVGEKFAMVVAVEERVRDVQGTNSFT